MIDFPAKKALRAAGLAAATGLLAGLSRVEGREPLVLVTGASSNHFRSLLNLLASFGRHEPGSTVVVYDLGLTEPERAQVQRFFPQCEFRRFLYENHPAYFNIGVAAGQYAWKPVIIREVFQEKKQNVMWLDAGCLLTRSLDVVRLWLRHYGFYSWYSMGRVSDWIHPLTIDRMQASHFLQKKMLSGGVVAFRYADAAARRLLQEWAEAAFRREIIAPEGSDRSNHRQDQAVLTLLFHQHMARQPVAYRYGWGILKHQDVESNA